MRNYEKESYLRKNYIKYLIKNIKSILFCKILNLKIYIFTAIIVTLNYFKTQLVNFTRFHN